MKEIRVETEINSTPDRVWNLLVDSPGFIPDEIREAVREGRIGAQLKVFMKTESGRGSSFRVKLLKAEPEKELRWKGRLCISGLFDGEHAFSIDSLSGVQDVLFIQQETFTGMFVPFLSRTLKDTQEEFQKTGQSLKAQAEAGGAT